MGNMFTEKNLEKILKDSHFTNEIHQRSLWKRIQAMPFHTGELSEEDLEAAAGGVTWSEPDVRFKRNGY